uniref:Uncharacterized protein n=1 Tax=viral metagenome TaxID=1070528 RepID=A0A6M3JF21_9ZZZZ
MNDQMDTPIDPVAEQAMEESDGMADLRNALEEYDEACAIYVEAAGKAKGHKKEMEAAEMAVIALARRLAMPLPLFEDAEPNDGEFQPERASDEDTF